MCDDDLSPGEILAKAGTATVYASHGAVEILPDRIRRFSGLALAGPVRVVRMAAHDNLALHEAIASSSHGTVVVGVTDRDAPAGYFGEIMARACISRDVAGVVLDATIRDVDQLIDLGLPVFATGTAIEDTKKEVVFAANQIEIDGTMLRDGDWIVADGTAVVCFPAEVLSQVLRRSRERFRRETKMIAEVERGVPPLDVLVR